MTTKITFDPTQKFGTVCGISTDHPGAKYQQGPHLFDTHRRCLNPDVLVKVSTDIDRATLELKKKLSAEADAAMVVLQKAVARCDEDSSPQAKSAHTKALNLYTKAQDKLDKLTER